MWLDADNLQEDAFAGYADAPTVLVQMLATQQRILLNRTRNEQEKLERQLA